MYRCGDCDAVAPDATGCPRCDGPVFAVGGSELQSYRLLRQGTLTNATAAQWLFGVKMVLLLLLAGIGGAVDLTVMLWDRCTTEAEEWVLAGVLCASAGALFVAFVALAQWSQRHGRDVTTATLA